MASFSLRVDFSVRYLTENSEQNGECEDCGASVPEWCLNQCQYGFCGKFFCDPCGFGCRRCDPEDPRSILLCANHASIARPSCRGCKKRFCDLCTDVPFSKCECCYSHYCSECQKQKNMVIDKQGTCDQCNTQNLHSLQQICRVVIRKVLQNAHNKTRSKQNSSGDIDKNVQSLPLPLLMKNYVCYQ